MSEINIFEIIQCIAVLIRSEERKRCTELRLQLIHFEVLDYLSDTNKYTDTPAATAAYFGMTRGTVSQSLIVLEKKGYVEKNKDETDKRIIHVELLPPGQAILKKARSTFLFKNANTFLSESVTDSANQRKIFLDVLNALQKATKSSVFRIRQTKSNDKIINPNVFDLIHAMAAIIRSEERKKCTELKLQLVHFQVLEYLSQCNKYSDTPAAISNYLGMTRGTVSQTLILLEKKQLIIKNQDLNDKRVFHIQLLAKGISTLNQAKPRELLNKAEVILEKKTIIREEDRSAFLEALTALQKANNSYSFGICKTCQNFTKTATGYFCELTKETLSNSDSEKVCQEHKVKMQ